MPIQPVSVQGPLAFTGEFRPLLDEKKRLTIPARWRFPEMTELFIITSPSHRCLSAMPLTTLEKISEDAAAKAETTEQYQSFKDHFFSSAVTCPVDSQGRMVLSEELCLYAGIKKETVLAGGKTKFDIWNPAAWGKRHQATAPNYETIMKRLGL